MVGMTQPPPKEGEEALTAVCPLAGYNAVALGYSDCCCCCCCCVSCCLCCVSCCLSCCSSVLCILLLVLLLLLLMLLPGAVCVAALAGAATVFCCFWFFSCWFGRGIGKQSATTTYAQLTPLRDTCANLRVIASPNLRQLLPLRLLTGLEY